ncbi:MAG: DUF1848 domain-containing protein [Lachnospiraceae bacterium]|nr:DUF1848 domain-containing protein [Lachnospiraceae bacterium]
MILSVSRRTDIPSYYSEWFLNRIKEGFLYVRNPMNPHQISKVSLSPDVVDCIVFWTKNPEPMLDRLEELAAYDYYFQFTLTGYGRDIECNVPHKRERMIPVFQRLSKEIGTARVVWRYDPILFNRKYTPEYHVKAFAQIAGELRGYTESCVISFVDTYRKNVKQMQELGVYELPPEELRAFAKELSRIATANGMMIATCAEQADLTDCGIRHSSCIDKERIERIIGCELKIAKDKNQRTECGCVESIEVGTYNTCRNGCRYCYANHSEESINKSCALYDSRSPLLCGAVTEADRITERKCESQKESQLRFWN